MRICINWNELNAEILEDLFRRAQAGIRISPTVSALAKTASRVGGELLDFCYDEESQRYDRSYLPGN